jgi:hypothetical protein
MARPMRRVGTARHPSGGGERGPPRSAPPAAGGAKGGGPKVGHGMGYAGRASPIPRTRKIYIYLNDAACVQASK